MTNVGPKVVELVRENMGKNPQIPQSPFLIKFKPTRLLLLKNLTYLTPDILKILDVQDQRMNSWNKSGGMSKDCAQEKPKKMDQERSDQEGAIASYLSHKRKKTGTPPEASHHSSFSAAVQVTCLPRGSKVQKSGIRIPKCCDLEVFEASKQLGVLSEGF